MRTISQNWRLTYHSKYTNNMVRVYLRVFTKKFLCLSGINKLNLLLHRQKGIKVIHEGIDMGIGFVPDLILENKLIIELKSVETLAEVHFKQLLTYLRLT